MNILETRFGKLEVRPTSADHIWVGTEGTSEIAINGVFYHGSAHYHLWADGAWHLGPEFTSHEDYGHKRVDRPTSEYERRQHINFSRREWTDYNKAHLSESAHKSLVRKLDALVNEWATGNTDVIRVAQQEHLQEQLERVQERLTNLMEQFNEAHDEEEEIKRELAELEED